MLSSPIDIALIAGVALIVFGPKRLPELGKALGQGLGNFKKHLQDAQNEVKTAMDSEVNLKGPAASSMGATPVAAPGTQAEPHAKPGCCGGHDH